MATRRFAYLDARLWQVDLERHLLAHEDVRVARLGEQRLEHVQLAARERRPLAALLPAGAVAPCGVPNSNSNQHSISGHVSPFSVTDTQTDRHTDTQTDTQTETTDQIQFDSDLVNRTQSWFRFSIARHKEGWKDRQTDRQTDRSDDQRLHYAIKLNPIQSNPLQIKSPSRL